MQGRVYDAVEVYNGVDVEEVVGFVLVGSEVRIGEVAKVVVNCAV